MLDQGVFNITLLRVQAQAEEVKAARVLEGFTRQIGLGFGQMAFKVTDGLATAFQQAVFNVHHQRVARPAVFNGLENVPTTCFGTRKLIEQH